MATRGKVALVTGGAEGIGKAIAIKLMEEHAKGVSILDVNELKLKETEEELKNRFGTERALFITCDVTSQKSLKDAFAQTKAQFGQLDIVCNNAGIWNEVNWSLMVDLNLKAVIHGTYLAIEMMGTKHGGNGGTIVNISSSAGLKCFPYMAAYSATKHGVRAFSVSLQEQVQCKDNNINIKVLCPSVVDTRLVNEKFVIDEESEKAFQFNAKRQLIPKSSTDDVAKAFIEVLGAKEMILTVTTEGNTNISSTNFLGP